MKKRVFLSHSHADRPFTDLLAADIEASGVAVWYDKQELAVGHTLTPEIEKAIAAADYVAVLLSPDSLRSEWVAKELGLGLRREAEGGGVVVLPLLLRGVQDTDIPAPIADRLYADFRRPPLYDTAVRQLLSVIRPGRRPAGQSSEWQQGDGVLAINSERGMRLARAAGEGVMRQWVLEYLTTAERPDPTERYWVYFALGEVGGRVAEAALSEAESTEENEFARRGVSEGLRRLRERASRREEVSRREKGGQAEYE